MKEKLVDLMHHQLLGLKINQYSYLVRDHPSSTNPHPWIHIYVIGNKITCSLRYAKVGTGVLYVPPVVALANVAGHC